MSGCNMRNRDERPVLKNRPDAWTGPTKRTCPGKLGCIVTLRSTDVWQQTAPHASKMAGYVCILCWVSGPESSL